jgi:hypothetical protein
MNDELQARIDTQLRDMTGHWRGAYLFGYDGDGYWALPLLPGSAALIRAETADELRGLVRTDHTRRTVKNDPSA